MGDEKDGGGGSSTSCNNRRHKVDLSGEGEDARLAPAERLLLMVRATGVRGRVWGDLGELLLPAVARRGQQTDGRALKVA